MPRHSTLTDRALLIAAIDQRATVYGLDDAPVGTLTGMIAGPSSVLLIVNIRGFLGIGCKLVTIPLHSVALVHDDTGALCCASSWTKDELYVLPCHTGEGVGSESRPLAIP